jgi:PST family polysaccharide transporter
MAVLLGPSGFGLLSLYNSITNLVQSIAEMGINSSGVRQIAEAVGSADNERVARTTTVLRRVSVLLGVFGAALLILFAKPLSALTFGNEDHAGAVALMSLAVLFSCISGGQGALIQGMRRIRDLAKMGVLGALYGTIISIPLVYLLGTRGIALSIVSVAGMGIFTSWWYSRKVRVQVPSMSASEIWREVLGLLKLGFAFMASALLMTGSAYAVRLILTHEAGFASAGFYQAAWTLGGLYVGFILQAMGADFYPRLTGVATDNSACNRMVNEQTLVSLLLAGPGIIATLTFAPVVIALFYSPQFAHAVDILRWLCLGMALRVISWPIGFILLAKGAQGWFLWSDVAWTIVHLGLAWICVKSFGAVGAGVAFFGSYVFHAIVNYFIVRMLSGFRWSKSNIRLAVVFASSIAVVFSCFRVLEPLVATVVGTLVVVLSSIYSVRTLINVIGLDQMPPAVRRLLAVFESRAAACSQE